MHSHAEAVARQAIGNEGTRTLLHLLSLREKRRGNLAWTRRSNSRSNVVSRPPGKGRQRGNDKRRGYTLIELLAVVSVSAVLLGIFLQLFVASSRLHALGAEALIRFEHIEDVEATFREAVRESTGVAEACWHYQTNTQCVVLERPGTGDTKRFALFYLQQDTNRMAYGVVTLQGASHEIEYWETLSPTIASVAFTYDEKGGVRMTYSLARDEDDGRAVQDYEVYATPQPLLAKGVEQ